MDRLTNMWLCLCKPSSGLSAGTFLASGLRSISPIPSQLFPCRRKHAFYEFKFPSASCQVFVTFLKESKVQLVPERRVVGMTQTLLFGWHKTPKTISTTTIWSQGIRTHNYIPITHTTYPCKIWHYTFHWSVIPIRSSPSWTTLSRPYMLRWVAFGHSKIVKPGTVLCSSATPISSRSPSIISNLTLSLSGSSSKLTSISGKTRNKSYTWSDIKLNQFQSTYIYTWFKILTTQIGYNLQKKLTNAYQRLFLVSNHKDYTALYHPRNIFHYRCTLIGTTSP